MIDLAHLLQPPFLKLQVLLSVATSGKNALNTPILIQNTILLINTQKTSSSLLVNLNTHFEKFYNNIPEEWIMVIPYISGLINTLW